MFREVGYRNPTSNLLPRPPTPHPPPPPLELYSQPSAFVRMLPPGGIPPGTAANPPHTVTPRPPPYSPTRAPNPPPPCCHSEQPVLRLVLRSLGGVGSLGEGGSEACPACPERSRGKRSRTGIPPFLLLGFLSLPDLRTQPSALVRIMGLEALQRREGLGDRRRSPKRPPPGGIPPGRLPQSSPPTNTALYLSSTKQIRGVDVVDIVRGQNGQKWTK